MMDVHFEPGQAETYKRSRDDRRKHHEGGSVIFEEVAHDGNLTCVHPCGICREGIVRVFIEFQFIPRFAVVAREEDADEGEDEERQKLCAFQVYLRRVVLTV